jgi:uncharacterized membrane protein (DUF106 family)
MVFENTLNPIFGPLLQLDSVISILIISLLVALLSTIIYKYATDQKTMKHLKEKMKKDQKKIKQLRNKPEEMLKFQKKSMATSFEYTKMSMKASLFTIIPILLIFGWIKGHLGYMPIMPGEEFQIEVLMDKNFDGFVKLHDTNGLTIVSNSSIMVQQRIVEGFFGDKIEKYAVFKAKAQEGNYILEFEADSEKQKKKLLVTTEMEYAPVEELYPNSQFKKIVLGNEKVKPLENVPVVKYIPWISGFGAIGTYILFSIIFGLGLRKLFKLY